MSVADWGDKTVDELALFIQQYNPELKGFQRRGLYKMVQFYETYAQTQIVSSPWTQLQNFDNQSNEIISTVRTQFEFQPKDIRNSILVQISWTHHRTIFSRCKSEEEREFYLRMSIKENYSVRELERQISASLFERVILGSAKTTSQPSIFSRDITNVFKDNYIFEFLNLPEPYSESDLQKRLIKQMKTFILELGRDFIFIDEEYKVQVGTVIFIWIYCFIIVDYNVW